MKPSTLNGKLRLFQWRLVYTTGRSRPTESVSVAKHTWRLFWDSVGGPKKLCSFYIFIVSVSEHLSSESCVDDQRCRDAPQTQVWIPEASLFTFPGSAGQINPLESMESLQKNAGAVGRLWEQVIKMASINSKSTRCCCAKPQPQLAIPKGAGLQIIWASFNCLWITAPRMSFGEQV